VLSHGRFAVSRREFLAASAAMFSAGLARPTGQERVPVPPEARLEGVVPFAAARAPDAPPLGRLLGDGLDARLFTDLSLVDEQRLITPTDQFFVRTAAPRALPPPRPWTIEVDGLVASPYGVDVGALAGEAASAGTHVFECAGNAHQANYGLLSAARWDGVPLMTVVERARPSADGGYVLVSGVDDTGPSSTSVPGCSWIFSRTELERTRAILALGLNGGDLPPVHGAPARLVVPGWYGCAGVKWVNRITVVAADAPPTTQMLEYSQRTHQRGIVKLAAEFEPPAIDTAAMPIRIERWTQSGRPLYRVVGVMWGGAKPVGELLIRFRNNEEWVAVDNCPLPASTATWTIWSHWWRPAIARRYEIVLKAADPLIPTRRLDVFYYIRDIDIDVV
jgi:DMSO/TMAO reductase YedYZ molybdopterin-dependent catalytic subunit